MCTSASLWKIALPCRKAARQIRDKSLCKTTFQKWRWDFWYGKTTQSRFKASLLIQRRVLTTSKQTQFFQPYLQMQIFWSGLNVRIIFWLKRMDNFNCKKAWNQRISCRISSARNASRAIQNHTQISWTGEGRRMRPLKKNVRNLFPACEYLLRFCFELS